MDLLRTVVRRRGAVTGVTGVQYTHENLHAMSVLPQPKDSLYTANTTHVSVPPWHSDIWLSHGCSTGMLLCSFSPPCASQSQRQAFEMHRMPDLCLSVVEITTWGVRFWSTIGKFSWALLVRNSRSRGERSATRGKYPLEEQLQVPSMPCRSGWHDLNSGSLIGWLVRQPMPERATTADLQPPEASPVLEVNLNAAGGTEPNFDHHSDNHVCQKMYRSLASRRLLSRVLECF
jgi:hypothetical protein